LIFSTDGKSAFAVVRVEKCAGYVLHIGYLKYGTLSVGTEVECVYDEHGLSTRYNQTACHVLDFALESVLNVPVDQKGSHVTPDKLRFSFSAKATPTHEQLQRIEVICNDIIRRNMPVHTRQVPLDLAKEIIGLRLVDCKEDPVRLVSVGLDLDNVLADPTNENWAATSLEAGEKLSSTYMLYYRPGRRN
jgi:alanyl-tRNA synthetase